MSTGLEIKESTTLPSSPNVAMGGCYGAGVVLKDRLYKGTQGKHPDSLWGIIFWAHLCGHPPRGGNVHLALCDLHNHIQGTFIITQWEIYGESTHLCAYLP